MENVDQMDMTGGSILENLPIANLWLSSLSTFDN